MRNFLADSSGFVTRELQRGRVSRQRNSRQAARERGETNIEETALEHEQERYGQKLAMHNCKPEEVSEINRKPQFRQWQHWFDWSVPAAAPRL